MKTPAEIKEYLQVHEWYNDFVDSSMKHYNSKNETEKVIRGLYGSETISRAFLWDESVKGFKFWHKVHKEFRSWYNNTDDNYYRCRVAVCSFKRDSLSKYERGIIVYAEDDKSIIIDKYGKIVKSVYTFNIYFDEGSFITSLK